MQMGVLAVSGAGMGPSRHTMALSAEFVCLLQVIYPSFPILDKGPHVQFGEILREPLYLSSPVAVPTLSVSSPLDPSLSILFTKDSCG